MNRRECEGGREAEEEEEEEEGEEDAEREREAGKGEREREVIQTSHELFYTFTPYKINHSMQTFSTTGCTDIRLH